MAEKKVNFRDAIQHCPANVTGVSYGSIYFDNIFLEKAISHAELLQQLDEELDPLQQLGLYMLVQMYRSRVGPLPGEADAKRRKRKSK